jgi:peptidoglycan hydrolase CwlO-like protein
MEKTTTLDATPDERAKYEAEIDHYLAEIERIQKQMAQDQREIEKLRAETRAMLTQLISHVEETCRFSKVAV